VQRTDPQLGLRRNLSPARCRIAQPFDEDELNAMRNIITTTFITLDGVLQAPGGPEEDKTGSFAHGGWQTAFPRDEITGSIMSGFMSTPFELLFGKITYDLFAAHWPEQKGAIADPFNRTKKYAVSRNSFEPSWHNTRCITGDVVTQIRKLKEEEGPDLWVWGSGNLIQTLLKHRLIDRMHLWIFPLTIGEGKRLFAEGTQATGFKLVDSKISTTGVIIATYEAAGDLSPLKVD
jgi:dihydrofolate reductase